MNASYAILLAVCFTTSPSGNALAEVEAAEGKPAKGKLAEDKLTNGWPQFLGPTGTPVIHHAPSSLTFSREDDLLWQTDLPPGSSSPCIWEDRIFITGYEDGQLVMLGIDRSDGSVIWRESVDYKTPSTYGHNDANPAVPTPCTDGTRVIFYFGDWGLIARDLDGALLWEKPLPVPKSANFGIGTSPILLDGMVILSRDGCPDSSIQAYSASDGELQWRVPRVGYSFSFGTPYVWENHERRELIVAGSQVLSSLDPTTGKELWRVTGLCSFVCTTPTSDDDTLYFAAWSTGGAEGRELVESLFGDETFTAEELADAALAFDRLDRDGDGFVQAEELSPCRAKDAFGVADDDGDGVWALNEYRPMHNLQKGPGENQMIAVEAGGEGDVSQTHVRWRHRRGIPYVASPILHEGRIWLFKNGGIVTCLDPETGESLSRRQRLDDRGEYYATPVGVPGHVIAASDEGTLYVLRSEDNINVVSRAEFGESLQATPALIDGTLYIRSKTRLYAFE